MALPSASRLSASLAGTLLILCLMGQLAAPTQAAPRLSCAKASTAVEKMICGDPALMDADQRMSRAFTDAMATSPDPTWLSIQQHVWTETLASSCEFPRKEVDDSFKHDCLADRYRDRIGALISMRDADIHDCAAASTQTARLICDTPTLKATEGKIEAQVEALAKSESETDPFHAWQLRRDQQAWRQGVYRSNTTDPCPSKYLANCIERIFGLFSLRFGQLGGFDSRRQLSETIPFDPPSDWWGIDVRAFFNGRDAEISQIFGGPGRSAVALVWGDEPLFVDVVTGKVVASIKENPELIKSGGDALKAVHQRFGLTAAAFTTALNTSQDITVYASDSRCPMPVNYALQYSMKGSRAGFLRGRYALARLSEQKRHDETNLRYCEDVEDFTWSGNFESLPMYPVARLADGTFLVTIDNRYLVRFRSDLTSPFFYGRTDVALVSQNLLDGLSGGWEPAFVNGVSQIIEATVERQRSAAHAYK